MHNTNSEFARQTMAGRQPLPIDMEFCHGKIKVCNHLIYILK